MALFLLYEIYRNQPATFLPALLALSAFYALYIWQRKNILKRFEMQKLERKQSEERVKLAIERWLRLYYCLEDDVVFAGGAGEPVPADLMPVYLFQEA